MDNIKNEKLSNEELKLFIKQMKLENEKLKYQAYEKCETIEEMIEKIENQKEDD